VVYNINCLIEFVEIQYRRLPLNVIGAYCSIPKSILQSAINELL
jgi:hypothetical protein